MDCLLNNTFLLTFKTLVWRMLWLRGLTVVSCCAIIPNSPRRYNKHQTRADEIGKCLGEGFEPTYYLSIIQVIGLTNASPTAYLLFHCLL